jgi:hypothetical protein
MLSLALLKVLPEGIQVNQELRILGLVLILYTPGSGMYEVGILTNRTT